MAISKNQDGQKPMSNPAQNVDLNQKQPGATRGQVMEGQMDTDVASRQQEIVGSKTRTSSGETSMHDDELTSQSPTGPASDV